MDKTNSAEQILEAAEARMRAQGYTAVSIRDIAADVGIKGASLYYHFPTKADLGAALVARYADKFYAALKKQTENITDPKKRIKIFIKIHRQALANQRLICLCAVLGAESQGLPNIVTQGVRTFFETNIKWLASNFKAANTVRSNERAKGLLCALEGGMIIAMTNDDISIFDAAAKTSLAEGF